MSETELPPGYPEPPHEVGWVPCEVCRNWRHTRIASTPRFTGRDYSGWVEDK